MESIFMFLAVIRTKCRDALSVCTLCFETLPYLWTIFSILSAISSSSPLLILQSVHLQFPLSLPHSSPLPLHLSLPSPHYPPTSAQGCQSFRDPVSCEIAQIAVALRLARQQRGERQKGEREREGEREGGKVHLSFHKLQAVFMFF